MRKNCLFFTGLAGVGVLTLTLGSFIILGIRVLPAAEKEAYKVGAIYSVTGAGSSLGAPSRDAIKLAEKEVNQAGGINGHPVAINIYNDESDETKAVLAAKRLIEQDKVLAIVGINLSGIALALVDTIEKAKIPFVACCASVKIVRPVKKWVFKIPADDSLEGELIVRYLKSKKISQVAVMNESTARGQSGREGFEEAATGSGITILTRQTYGQKDIDVSAQLTSIKATNPQAILAFGTTQSSAVVARNAKQMQINVPIIFPSGAQSPVFFELAGDAANGSFFVGPTLPVWEALPPNDPQKPVIAEFRKAYSAAYSKDPDVFAGYTWDASHILFSSLKSVGTDQAKIRDYIENIQRYVGTTAVFSFSPQRHCGASADSLAMLQVIDKKWTLSK